jgi:hypothetical protein
MDIFGGAVSYLRNKSRLAWLAIFAACVTAAFVMSSRFAASARAAGRADEETPVLVELFTSEGCSSCPPADALLASLDREQKIPGARVIVLSEHVDYWDHEGWRDPFSSPGVTARQDAYVARLSQESAYTPEAVVDGTRGLTGSDRRGLINAIESAAQRPKIRIRITGAAVTGNSVAANLSVAALPHADLYAVLADDHDQSSVLRGENSGRRLDHVAVVRSIEKIGSLNDGYSRQIQIALPAHAEAKMRLVVFAQERGTGPVLGVAEADL